MQRILEAFRPLFPFPLKALWMWWLLPLAASALLWQLLHLLGVITTPYVGAIVLLPLIAYVRLYTLRVASLSFWPGTIGFLCFTGITIALSSDMFRVAEAGLGIVEARTGTLISMPILWLAMLYAAALGVIVFMPISEDEPEEQGRAPKNKKKR